MNTEQVNKDITALDINGIQYWMSWYILEVRKMALSTHQTHYITSAVEFCIIFESQRLKDSSFTNFCATLDGEMKRLQSLSLQVSLPRNDKQNH